MKPKVDPGGRAKLGDIRVTDGGLVEALVETGSRGERWEALAEIIIRTRLMELPSGPVYPVTIMEQLILAGWLPPWIEPGQWVCGERSPTAMHDRVGLLSCTRRKGHEGDHQHVGQGGSASWSPELIRRRAT